MKTLLVCQLVDHASETVVSTFTAPTKAIMQRNFNSFLDDCKAKGIPVEPFVCFIAGVVKVCETYDEACKAISMLRDGSIDNDGCVLYVGDDDNDSAN